MHRTMQAFHMQTKLPTSNIPDFLGATLRASMYAQKKTKSAGGRAGLSAHVKLKNTLHTDNAQTCSPDYSSGCGCCGPCLPTSSVSTRIQSTSVQSSCRTQGRQEAKQRHAQDDAGIPHADQAANPFTSECEDHRIRHANLGRNSRQTNRFGSPFQAACRRLTLSVTSLCVRKDPSLLGGSAGFKSVPTLKTPRGRSFKLLSQKS